jgi:hypothetical protein
MTNIGLLFTIDNVEVETESSRLSGLTSFKVDPAGNNEVAFEVDADRFFSLYFGTIES